MLKEAKRTSKLRLGTDTGCINAVQLINHYLEDK